MNEKLKKRIGMTLAYMGGSPIFLIISAYLTYFYTNVAGLNPGVVGTILLVSRVLDGISDLVFHDMLSNLVSPSSVPEGGLTHPAMLSKVCALR